MFYQNSKCQHLNLFRNQNYAMSRCPPAVSPSTFDLFVSSEISKINSMLSEGQKVLSALERGQSTPKRACSRGGSCQTSAEPRHLLSPKSPECVFSPKLRKDPLIGAMADKAANLIVDSLISRSNALIPDLESPPRTRNQRYPAQESGDLMGFEEVSPVIKAPHSAARRFLNRPPKQAMLFPKSDLYSGTPTPVPGKWLPHGRSRMIFVPEGSSMPR